LTETIAIAIPAHDEGDYLPDTLADLAAQSDQGFAVWVCVNQPETYAASARHAAVDGRNRTLADRLEATRFPFRLVVIRALDPGEAPEEGVAGAGWARKRLFETIAGSAERPALIVSLDADTRVGPEYVAAIRRAFAACPNGVALAVPYWHPIPEERDAARAMLCYEIYLRYYQVSLWRIGSPYAFLAIGSGMAFRTAALDRFAIGKPRKAGEDFYLMQQLRKIGPVIRYADTVIRPSPRSSARNPFGTGAVVADPTLLARSYPLYDQGGFDALAETFARFPGLYDAIDLALPIDDFLAARLGGRAPFVRMRDTAPDRAHFVRACHERIDGLRTLQWLRFDRARRQREGGGIDALLARLGYPAIRCDPVRGSLESLAEARALLAGIERDFQEGFMTRWDVTTSW